MMTVTYEVDEDLVPKGPHTERVRGRDPCVLREHEPREACYTRSDFRDAWLAGWDAAAAGHAWELGSS